MRFEEVKDAGLEVELEVDDSSLLRGVFVVVTVHPCINCFLCYRENKVNS